MDEGLGFKQEDNFYLPADSWHHVDKGWGSEDWIYNNNFCGKILFVKKGKKLSWHYHRLKSEVMTCLMGRFIMRYGWDEKIGLAKERILTPPDAFYIPSGLIHQIEALEDTRIFEFSTEHFDSDSYRIIKGD